MIWVPRHSDIPGNCRADEIAIKLSNEFSNLGISMRTCNLIIDNAMTIPSTATGLARTQVKRLVKSGQSRMSPFKPQRGEFSVVVGIITRHCIMDTHGRLLGLGLCANNFCWRFRRREDYHSLGSCPTLCQKRRKELSSFDVDSVNWVLRSSEWFLD